MATENENEHYRAFPEQENRVETGAVRFGDDWPGVFVRGDNAMAYALNLETALNHLPASHAIIGAHLRGLVRVLRSCDMRTMREGPEKGPDSAA